MARVVLVISTARFLAAQLSKVQAFASETGRLTTAYECAGLDLFKPPDARQCWRPGGSKGTPEGNIDVPRPATMPTTFKSAATRRANRQRIPTDRINLIGGQGASEEPVGQVGLEEPLRQLRLPQGTPE